MLAVFYTTHGGGNGIGIHTLVSIVWKIRHPYHILRDHIAINLDFEVLLVSSVPEMRLLQDEA